MRVYNTLTRSKEHFVTIRTGKVGMYVCGPTVYSPSHIGHMVGPVVFDTIKRYLVYCGYEVTWVLNITDIDDKLITQAQEEGTTVKELAERVTRDYVECLKALSVDGIDHMPRATEHIDDIIAINQSLIAQGYAYESGGDVYFNINQLQEYGKLSHREPESLLAGARVELSTLKHHPGDFALWKRSKPGEPSWESPWGPGRPGWHIECSAMSMKYLGGRFDIHGGGLDLVFPHHENELAQSESYTGGDFATYWLHNGLLTRGGKKISKSDPETVVLMSDLLRSHEPDTLRTLLLSGHYRRPIDFGLKRLDEIERGLQIFYRTFKRLRDLIGQQFHQIDAPRHRDEFDPGGSALLTHISEHRQRFLDAMDDDFNTGGALGELFDIARILNRFAVDSLASGAQSAIGALAEYRTGVIVLKELSQILGLFSKPHQATEDGSDPSADGLLQILVDLRTLLRKEKSFALADEVRSRLAKVGVILEDQTDGTVRCKRVILEKNLSRSVSQIQSWDEVRS